MDNLFSDFLKRFDGFLEKHKLTNDAEAQKVRNEIIQLLNAKGMQSVTLGIDVGQTLGFLDSIARISSLQEVKSLKEEIPALKSEMEGWNIISRIGRGENGE